MLAYAASRPAPIQRRPHPNAMLFIIAAHVAAIAAVMSAKMELPPRIMHGPIKIDFIDDDPPPPPNPIETPTRPQPSATFTQPTSVIPIPVQQDLQTPTAPTGVNTSSLGTGAAVVIPEITPPKPYPVKLGPQLATPASELKPPYPLSKIASEEEAVLKLRLTIDANGRVVAVEPLGRADPVFLAAARRHLLAHWRYKPATEGDHAVTSSTVITLRFELDA